MSARYSALGALAVAAFYGVLFALAPADRPVVMADNAGYLAIGRWLANTGVTPDMTGAPFYAWGYGALFAPPYVFTTDISVTYAYGVVANCLFGGALFAVLRAIVARAARAADATVVSLCAAAGACWSGVALQSGQIWPENALAFGVALWVLAVQRLAAGERRAPLTLGLIAGALFAVHHRTAGIAIVTAVLLAWQVRCRRPGAVAGAAALVGGVALTLLVDAAVRAAIYPRGTVAFPLSGALEVPGTFLRVIAGELWVSVAGSAGLAALAVAWLLGRRRDAFGAALLAAVVLTVVISAAHLAAALAAGHRMRADYLAYGRYVAPLVPPLLALGAARLTVGGRPRAPLVAVGALSALMFVLHGLTVHGDPNPVNIPGILGMGAGALSLKLLVPSVIALAAAGLLVWLSGRGGRLAIATTLALVAIASVSGARELRRWHDAFDGRASELVAAIDRVPGADRIAVEPPRRADLFVLLQMLRPQRQFAYESTTSASSASWVVAPHGWPAARRLGARRVTGLFEPDALWCVGRGCQAR